MVERERQQKIRQLREQEIFLNTQIAELEAKLKKCHGELSSIHKQRCELEIVEETARYVQKVSKLNEENSIAVELDPQTKTTPIMDAFMSSNKEFLVFRHLFRLSPSWKQISLIVAKSTGGINYMQSNLTMTDLKRAAGTLVSKNLTTQMSKNSRLYPLYIELTKIENKVARMHGAIHLDIPCLLGGQTYREQCGYGWEYCGEELIHQGKEYGETAKFMIIGVWVDTDT